MNMIARTVAISAALALTGCAQPSVEGQDIVERSTTSTQMADQSIELDHPTYEGLGNITAAADLVVVGEVAGSEPGSPVDLGADAAGNDLGELPFVNYVVRVSDVVGGELDNNEIVITYPGGASQEAVYSVEGLGDLPVGEPLLFFLDRDSSGTYVALVSWRTRRRYQDVGWQFSAARPGDWRQSAHLFNGRCDRGGSR